MGVRGEGREGRRNDGKETAYFCTFCTKHRKSIMNNRQKGLSWHLTTFQILVDMIIKVAIAIHPQRDYYCVSGGWDNTALSGI